MSTKLSINISNDTAQILRSAAERNDTSVTDIVRRAVKLYDAIQQAVESGRNLRVTDKDGNQTYLVVLL